MAAIHEPMGRKKTKPIDLEKKAPFYFKMDPRIRMALDQAALDLASDVSTEIKIAIRERLEKLGYWPPKD